MKTLLGQMRYFKQHLAADVETRPEASAELSVHCDIPTFEWLVDHAEGRDPRVTTTNCVALMISSDFLRMASLTDKCADYVAANAHEICALGADLANLARGLLEKIASTDERRRAGVAAGDERRRCRPRGAFRRASGGSREKNDSTDSKRALAATLYRVKTEALIASTARGRRGDDRPMRRVRLAVQRETPLRLAMPEGEAPRGLSRRRHRATRADERL